MISKSYCLASAKGGSGKTILCASFAAFLAELGKKVLIVDIDPATNGLTLLYLNEVNRHKLSLENRDTKLLGIFDDMTIFRDHDIVHLPNNVDLLPATYRFEIEDLSVNTDLLSLLKGILDKARSQYDFILFDAQAGTDPISRAAMRKDLCDEVIIVAEYDPLSAAGIERLKGIMRDDLTYVRTWVLLNKMLPDFVESFSDFLEVSRYLSPIPWDAEVVRAYARRKLPLDLIVGNQFTLSIMHTLKRLLGEEISSEIDKWSEGKAAIIRQPIEDQYQDAEKELKGLLERKAAITRANEKIYYTRPFIVSNIVLIPLLLLYVLIRSSVLSHDWLQYFEIALIFTGIALGTYVYATLMKRSKNVGVEVEEARFVRQISIIEEKLKRLEILRKADLQTLVKEKK